MRLDDEVPHRRVEGVVAAAGEQRRGPGVGGRRRVDGGPRGRVRARDARERARGAARRRRRCRVVVARGVDDEAAPDQDPYVARLVAGGDRGDRDGDGAGLRGNTGEASPRERGDAGRRTSARAAARRAPPSAAPARRRAAGASAAATARRAASDGGAARAAAATSHASRCSAGVSVEA